MEVRTGTVTAGSKTVDPDPKERYLWDQSYIDAPAMIERDTDLNGSKDQTLWPTFDANFNVTGLLTDQGVTVERYAYTPYGERIVLNGDQSYANSGADPDGAERTVDTNGSDFGFLLGFQGKRFEAETGNWNFLARYQNPALGTFGQRDPLLDRYQDGMNLPQFEKNNPVVNLDPLGMFVMAVPAAPVIISVIIEGGVVIGIIIVGQDGVHRPLGPVQPPISNDEIKKLLEKRRLQQQAKQQRAEHAACTKVCNEFVPPNIQDPCERERWIVERMKRCLAMRKPDTRVARTA